MTDLRKEARGRPCQLRFSGVCNGNKETTVLCHLRRSGIAGMGEKVPDLVAIIGCSNCHRFLDNHDLTKEWRMLREEMIGSGDFFVDVLDALCRTLALWSREGVL